MISGWPCWCWKLVLASILAVGRIAIAGDCSLAQITPDRTLGSESSVITPNVTIKELPGDRIDGGAVRGANLFHSFSQFNVRELQRVYFANPAGIENILSRVTGTEISSILGTLGVLGNANLFLINPNGIIFGPNARLDIRGSFVATTANGIQLGENGLFSATNPQSSQLLSIQPGALFLHALAQHQAAIRNQGNLAVGQDLTLAAGNLELQGQLYAGENLTLHALDTLRVRDSAIAPFIAAAGNQLLVQGDRGIDIFALNHPNSGLFSGRDMVLRSANPVGGDAHYWSGGSFRIEQLDGRLGNLVSFDDPIIRSQGDVSFFAYQGASLHILAGGSVNINTVVITEPDTTGDTINPTATPDLANVTLSDGTSLIIDGSTRPTLDVRAGMKSEAIGSPLGTIGGASGTFFDPSITPIPPPANNPVATGADININSIFNNGGVVFLTNQYQPNPAISGGITFGAIDTSSDLGGGPIAIDSRERITVNDLLNVSGGDLSTFDFSGNGGDVTLLANGNITVNPGASIFSLGLLGGKIALKSEADISITSGAIDSVSFSPVTGTTGGAIQVMARSLSISNGAELGTFTFGGANAGSVVVQASDSVSIDGRGFLTGVFSKVLSGARGNGGNLTIETKRLLVHDGAEVSTSTSGEGDAGDLTVTAQSVEVIGTSDIGQLPSRLTTQTEASGDGGNLTIDTERLLARDGALISASTFGEGDAGDLTVTAQSVEVINTSEDREFSSGLFAQVNPGASGDGGNLRIHTGHLLVSGGALVAAGTGGEGDAGGLTVTAQSIELIGTSEDGKFSSGLFTAVARGASGIGGNLIIDTERLLVRDGAQVSASTFGEGDAGDLFLTTGSVEIRGTSAVGNFSSRLSTQVNPEAIGDGGLLTIDTGRLLVADGAQVSVETRGVGRAGDATITAETLTVETGGSISASTSSTSRGGSLIVTAPESVTIRGNGHLAVETSGAGNAGNLNINTQQLTIENGAQATVSSTGTGKAGNLEVNARNVLLNDRARLTAETQSSSGGDITLNGLDTLKVFNSRISASTIDGSAGSLRVNASESVRLSENSRLSVEATEGGSAGSLQVETQQMTIEEDSRVTVSSPTGQAGNLDITANSLTLDRGFITAETGMSQEEAGANIQLKVADNLFIGNESRISANAFGAANGGNIDLDTQFLIALPPEGANGSDIRANAEFGSGGRVNITAQGILGIEFRESLTPLNDITASSEFGTAGIVALDTPNTDPSRGLDAPSASLVDPSEQIAQGCSPGERQRANRFIATGRGGLPLSPDEPLESRSVVMNWVELPESLQSGRVEESRSRETNLANPQPSAEIVEAQGWKVDSKGNVVLVAQLPVGTPAVNPRSQVSPPSCY